MEVRGVGCSKLKYLVDEDCAEKPYLRPDTG